MSSLTLCPIFLLLVKWNKSLRCRGWYYNFLYFPKKQQVQPTLPKLGVLLSLFHRSPQSGLCMSEDFLGDIFSRPWGSHRKSSHTRPFFCQKFTVMQVCSAEARGPLFTSWGAPKGGQDQGLHPRDSYIVNGESLLSSVSDLQGSNRQSQACTFLDDQRTRS